jgi:hypothetical protein
MLKIDSQGFRQLPRRQPHLLILVTSKNDPWELEETCLDPGYKLFL